MHHFFYDGQYECHFLNMYALYTYYSVYILQKYTIYKARGNMLFTPNYHTSKMHLTTFSIY